MNIRIILAVSTVIGIMVGDLLARQTEARASQNFSRYYVAQTTIPAEEDSYQSPRNERKLVKSSTLIKTSELGQGRCLIYSTKMGLFLK